MDELISSTASLKLPFKYQKKRIGTSYLLVHSERPSWIIVNDFGLHVTELLNMMCSIPDTVRALLEEYDADEKIIEKDVHEFVMSLLRAGMIDDSALVKPSGVFEFPNTSIYITSRCNLKCKHCFYSDGDESHKQDIDKDLMLNYVDSFCMAGGKQITMCGGEPLIRMDLVKSVVEKNRKIRINVLTNGILINDEFAGFVADSNVFVQVSIDGSTAKIHDSIRGESAFRGAIKGIEILQRKGLSERIIICTTMMRQNISDLKNVIELAVSLKVPFIRFVPLRKEGRACTTWSDINSGVSIEDYEKFYRYVFEKSNEEYPEIKISSGLCGFVLNQKSYDKNGHWCTIGRNLIVDSDGSIYPCSMFMCDDYKIGNIKTHTIDNLIQSNELARVVDLLTQRKNRVEKCSTCIWKNLCQAGCMGLANGRYGSIWESDGFCKYRKELYEEAIMCLVKGRRMTQGSNWSSECG